MTHEELLAKIDEYKAEYYPVPSELLNTLRAVVELHKPLDNLVGEFCDACTDGDIYALYPCQTIQVIEKELNG